MLTAGTHTLTSFDLESLNHCILVKLTDTSAKYIQEFIKKSDADKKTFVNFSKDKGEISFSTSKAGDIIKKFQFGVSSIKGSNKDGTASFECVSYLNKRLESIGSIEQKLTIQGTDEAFQTTKERVTSFVEEEKKNYAIEINSSGTPHRANRHKNANNAKNFKRITDTTKSLPVASLGVLNKNNRDNNNLENGTTSLKLRNKTGNSTEAKLILPKESTLENIVEKNSTSPRLKQHESPFQTIETASKPLVRHSPQSIKQNASKSNSPKPEANSTSIQKSDQEIKSFWDSGDLNELIKYDSYSNINQTEDDPKCVKEFKQCSTSENVRKSEMNKFNETDDFSITSDDELLKLEKVQSLDQRKELKGLFDRMYPEYIDLRNYMEPITNLFSNFRQEIQFYTKGSKEYEELHEKIIKTYKEKHADPIFACKNERYHEIYTKLERIYNLIKDFDGAVQVENDEQS